MTVVVEHEQFGELYCPSCEETFSEGRLCPNDGARLVKLSLAPDPIIGRELDGRFTVVEKLGEGGMGAVYRAHQHSVDREVAVKVVHVNLVSNPQTIMRFLREAKLTSKLNHPNAVAVLDFGQTEDGVFYLVMELVPGRPLDEILKEETSLSPTRVVRIGMQVCDALEMAHAQQIVHRDLKPANIMVDEARRDFVKVLDFGLAKTLEVRRQDTTREETLLGTPAFLPPERASGAAGDARSDLYSLGCVLYLLASGTLPFSGDTPKEVVAAHASGTRPTPLANVPPSIGRVIDKLLSKNPDDRYQTAGATRDALEEAAMRDGVHSYQSSPNLEHAFQASMRMATFEPEETEIAPTKRSRRGLVIGLAAAVIALAVFAIAWSSRGSSDDGAARPAETSPATAPTGSAATEPMAAQRGEAEDTGSAAPAADDTTDETDTTDNTRAPPATPARVTPAHTRVRPRPVRKYPRKPRPTSGGKTPGDKPKLPF